MPSLSQRRGSRTSQKRSATSIRLQRSVQQMANVLNSPTANSTDKLKAVLDQLQPKLEQQIAALRAEYEGIITDLQSKLDAKQGDQDALYASLSRARQNLAHHDKKEHRLIENNSLLAKECTEQVSELEALLKEANATKQNQLLKIKKLETDLVQAQARKSPVPVAQVNTSLARIEQMVAVKEESIKQLEEQIEVLNKTIATLEAQLTAALRPKTPSPRNSPEFEQALIEQSQQISHLESIIRGLQRINMDLQEEKWAQANDEQKRVVIKEVHTKNEELIKQISKLHKALRGMAKKEEAAQQGLRWRESLRARAPTGQALTAKQRNALLKQVGGRTKRRRQQSRRHRQH